MNHYIGTLDDSDLARMLTMLRLVDTDDLEETPQELDVRVILRTSATTCVPYASKSARKESARWNSFTT